jgi:hypothetical protein
MPALTGPVNNESYLNLVTASKNNYTYDGTWRHMRINSISKPFTIQILNHRLSITKLRYNTYSYTVKNKLLEKIYQEFTASHL